MRKAKGVIPASIRRLWLPYRAFSRRPVSNIYGFDRGHLVDRFYIENFLERNQKDVKGKCLELLNRNYTSKFGGKKVIRSDILDIDRKNAQATLYGDLRDLKDIKTGTYDCIILTQVLQFIDDFEAGVRECHRILKKGGVMLVSVPAVSRADVASGVDNDFWRFTRAGARYMFAKVFDSKNVQAESHGNVLAGVAFWVGAVQEDLTKEDLAYNDPNFPVLITVRAVKK